ncbi:MAG: hypothetical protein JOZ24_12345, partial [Candidatus Eremiobacteraeota bacterium]|nr:hypothetical protein [Candidatus Eremiobacteraeota bacterium]
VGSPATGGNSTVTAFQLQNTGTAFAPVTTTTLAGPAVGVSLDPTERFLYVGGLGQMWTVTLDANGGFGSATATQTGGAGTVTTLGDYPGGAAGAPDARVWGAESDNLVFAVSTVGATTQTVRLTAIPVGIGFVP